MNLKKLQNLFEYPAISMTDSFIYSSDFLFPLQINTTNLLDSTYIQNGQTILLKDFLNERKIDPTSAIVSYGANASLKYLQEKTIDPLEVFPVIQTVLLNRDVVYASYYCSDGTIPATLIEKPGASVNVFFSFISDAQLDTLNTSENLDLDYRLAEIDLTDAVEGLSFLKKLYFYECLHGPLIIEGVSFSMAAINGTGRCSDPFTQYDIQRMAFERYFEHDNFYAFCMETIQNSDLRQKRTQTLKRGG